MVAKQTPLQGRCCEAKTLMAMKKSKKPMINGSSAELSPVDARQASSRHPPGGASQGAATILEISSMIQLAKSSFAQNKLKISKKALNSRGSGTIYIDL